MPTINPASPASEEIIPLYTGTAPGSEGWMQQEQTGSLLNPQERLVRNVVDPTLTAFLPTLEKNRGTAVIVCPGGAHHFLAMDHEGYAVARWLVERGIAAFVLKYRLVPTAPDDEGFRQQMLEVFSTDQMPALVEKYGPLQAADGLQAIRLVRSRAESWGISPERVGILGFSAGGFVALKTALLSGTDDRPDDRPDFCAPIYAAMFEEFRLPENPPPLFLAYSLDDPIAAEPGSRIFTAWRGASRSVELHVYARGGHGYGMNKQGLPSDGWIERFLEWLTAEGF